MRIPLVGPDMKAILLLLLCVAAHSASAQWTYVPGLDSGNVSSLMVDGQRLYAATNYYGLVKSEDNGNTWVRVAPDSSFYSPIIYLLATDSLLYASTYQNIYRSSDLGNTWKELPSKFKGSLSIRGLGFHNKKIYLSIDSIYRSTDWGDTWETKSTNVNPGHQFVTIGKNLFTVSAEAGAFRSTNDGDMWYWLPVAGPNGVAGTSMTAVGSKLFMGTGGHGIYRTTNYGQTWSITAPFLGEDVSGLAARGNKLFASWGNLGGVTMSLDTGKTWNQINYGLGCYNVRKIICNDQYLFVWAVDGGLWRRPLDKLAVAEDVESLSPFTIYPNPASTYCTITYKEGNAPLKIEVLDLLGRSLLTQSGIAGQHSLLLDTRTLTPGNYLISLTAGSLRTIQALCISR